VLTPISSYLPVTSSCLNTSRELWIALTPLSAAQERVLRPLAIDERRGSG
jgi:hypothetical protein